MDLIRKHTCLILLFAASCFFLPTSLYAETASFDGLTEGVIGNELTDGGITFFNLDNGQPGLENVFIIEQADGSLTDPTFSSPNGLTSTSYTSGNEVGFGPIKEMSISAGGDADAADIDLFTTATLLYNNTVTLEAIKDGVVVQSVSKVIQNDTDDHFTLSIDGVTFDTLRVVSSPDSQVLMLDNVTINTIDICECDIEPDGVCDMNDWRLFGQDWGRDDCIDAEDLCECDLNQDGVCDMNDYRLFGQDWGRDDCPMPLPLAQAE